MWSLFSHTQVSAPVLKPPISSREAPKLASANPQTEAVRQDGSALGVVLGLGALRLPSFKVPADLWDNPQAQDCEYFAWHGMLEQWSNH